MGKQNNNLLKNMKDYDCVDGKQKWNGKYRRFKSKSCTLIPIEIDRLEYLISYCLKNYYIGHANQVANGKYVPKWKYESYKNEYRNRVNEVNNPEVKVIVNGHRYHIT